MRYFWGLDVIRFAAALMVVVYHFSAFGGNRPAWPVDPSVAPFGGLTPIAWMGWIGVQIFFVLSGFVIAASARGSSFDVFLRKRAIRLLPTLWISASIALAARALWGEPLVELVPAFLKTLVLSPKGPHIDGVVWTLVVEAAFYLSISIVILSARFLGGIERALAKFALFLGSVSGAFLVLLWMSESATGALAEASGAFPPASFAYDVLLLRQGVFFALGMVLFETVDRGVTRGRSIAMAGLALLCILQIGMHVGSAAAIYPILAWSLCTLLIYLGARYGDRIFKPEVRSILRPVGLMTYALYLNHFVLGAALLPLLDPWIDSRLWLFCALLSIVLLNAWIIARYPERWIQRRLKRTLFERSNTSNLGSSVVEGGFYSRWAGRF